MFTARYGVGIYICNLGCMLYMDLRTTAIISLYNINWLVFITETECVYCAVRTEYLNL